MPNIEAFGQTEILAALTPDQLKLWFIELRFAKF
jgi:hypothetical protein